MMKSLKLFYLTLKELFSKHQPSTLVVVKANENLSRFIFSERHFSRHPPRVKAEAFMPRKGEVSVFRKDGLNESQIWNIGREIESIGTRTLHGRGDIITQSAMKIGLQVTPSESPARHANIVGWPDDKAKQKLLALELAGEASLMIKP